MGTSVRSPRAGQTSSCLVAAELASSSEVHELLRDLGALAVTQAHTLLHLQCVGWEAVLAQVSYTDL